MVQNFHYCICYLDGGASSAWLTYIFLYATYRQYSYAYTYISEARLGVSWWPAGLSRRWVQGDDRSGLRIDSSEVFWPEKNGSIFPLARAAWKAVHTRGFRVWPCVRSGRFGIVCSGQIYLTTCRTSLPRDQRAQNSWVELLPRVAWFMGEEDERKCAKRI
jgi:hypothetical protein